MSKNRRKFLKTIAPSIMGATITPKILWSQSNQSVAHASDLLDAIDEKEAFCEAVQLQFKFADGLTYFNNGSLDACPKPIRDTTMTTASIVGL